jgi:hypothetical protein
VLRDDAVAAAPSVREQQGQFDRLQGVAWRLVDLFGFIPFQILISPPVARVK